MSKNHRKKNSSTDKVLLSFDQLSAKYDEAVRTACAEHGYAPDSYAAHANGCSAAMLGGGFLMMRRFPNSFNKRQWETLNRWAWGC